MIDIENEVRELVETALRAEWPTISLYPCATPQVTSYPFVVLEEIDNHPYAKTADSSGEEKYAVTVWEANVYSNKIGEQAEEAKAIFAVIDGIFSGLGFARDRKKPVNLGDSMKYRLNGRWSAVVSQDHKIYRR